MTTPLITPTPPDRQEPLQPEDETCLSRFDDEALAHALKTVNWHAKDVSQFLRSVAYR